MLPPETTAKTIRVVICPTPGCPSYYGSTSMGDLPLATNKRSAMKNAHYENPEQWGKVIGTRDECPECKAEGIRIRRVVMDVTIQVPTESESPVDVLPDDGRLMPNG